MNKEELKKVIREHLVFLHIESSEITEEFFEDLGNKITSNIDSRYIPFLIKIIGSKNYYISPQDTDSFYEYFLDQDKNLFFHVLTLNYKTIDSTTFAYHFAHSLDVDLSLEREVNYLSLMKVEGTSLLEVLTKEVNERKLKSKLGGRMSDNTRKLFYHLVSFILTDNQEKLRLIQKELPTFYEASIKLFHFLEKKKPILNS